MVLSLNVAPPDTDTLLQLQPEELAWILLKLAKQRLNNRMFHPQSIEYDAEKGQGRQAHWRPTHELQQRVDVVIVEGWN